MNVLLLDQFSEPGGAQMVLLDTLAAIRARGWRALVGLPGEGELFERIRELGFSTERIHCGPYQSGRKSAGDLFHFALDTPRLSIQVRRLSSRFRPDLIYVNGPRILPAAALAVLDTPVLFHTHSYLPAGAVRRAATWSLRRLRARVAAACEFVAEPWSRAVGEQRVRAIYNGVAAAAVRQERGGALRVGFIGRIAPEKGVREFIQVARRVIQAKPEVRFIVHGARLFSGGEYEREVRALAADLPIEFAGWTADVGAALSEVDLLLVPSVGPEATTRVILEAFAAGVPVIAFPAGGIPEVVEHGVNGLLVHTVEAMAEAVVSMNPSSFSAAARATWASRFTVDRYRNEIVECMELAVSQR